MSILESTPNEIINIVNLLKSGSSVGNNEISSVVVKAVILEISKPLNTIINLSLKSGQFPNQLKIAKIIPIYKSSNKKEVCNYRPISVLPFFSKMFEKVMYNRLAHYLDTYTILTHNHFGFRKNHSTYMALLSLIDDISNELNNKNHSVGIFIHLSKAFDTIDHNLLLKKMEYYGIRGIVLVS